ncbi:hypothetical protein [Sphaerisporangium fuscum]|uniref:hypothetical protein n=1 Tax=Sphaerisporangium fuscum TaxID=2835868 RepID=UPI001BDD95E6|nr:hypothetical protein [Sphaerisporangium fuscum]
MAVTDVAIHKIKVMIISGGFVSGARQPAAAVVPAGMVAIAVLCLHVGLWPAQTANAATTTTAWRNGGFSVDTPNVVRRSDIVLGAPNTRASQFVPLGNGTLGAAVWAADGFTAQLNRSDTFPARKSPDRSSRSRQR